MKGTQPRFCKGARRRVRLWPRGITGRLIVVLALGMAIAQGLTVLIYWHSRPSLTVQDMSDRIVAVAVLLQKTEVSDQKTLLDALNSPLFSLEPIPPPQSSPRKKIAALQSLEQALSRSLETPFQLALRHHRNPGQRRWPSHQQLEIKLSDRQGQWWKITMPYSWEPHRRRLRLLWLFIIGSVIWIGLTWITRRMTRPILQFAAAADRLGIDVNAPPLPEHGSKELREAAQAFNQMQTRLQQLITDRTFMLAAISHDLRTILTRLRLRTEFIEDEPQRLKAGADLAQMEAMLTATIAFTKEESTPEAHTLLDLRSLLQSICDDLTDAGYSVELREGDSPQLQGRPTALRRAFTNLIENAALYGDEATVSIQVEKEWAWVVIVDKGPGVPEPIRQQVFQPFFRLEPSRNRDTGGTGLGLAVAQTVIRRHRGDIQLHDGNDVGLEVRASLPLT